MVWICPKPKTRNLNDEQPKWNNNNSNIENNIKTDYLIFADGANIGLPDMNNLNRQTRNI